MYRLTLQWTRCPDGVELFDYYGGRQGPVGPRYRYLSAKRGTTRYDLDDFRRPIVLAFVNARRPPALKEFFTQFGLLHEGQSEISVEEAVRIQKEVRRSLYCICAQKRIDARTMANRFLSAGQVLLIPSLERRGGQAKARLTLRSRTLIGFMAMEIAMLAAEGAELTSCQRCGGWFCTGYATGRRWTGVYCSLRCRVAAHRARGKVP
jgi:hypothetical protein